jgi:hypothetical protein
VCSSDLRKGGIPLGQVMRIFVLCISGEKTGGTCFRREDAKDAKKHRT